MASQSRSVIKKSHTLTQGFVILSLRPCYLTHPADRAVDPRMSVLAAGMDAAADQDAAAAPAEDMEFEQQQQEDEADHQFEAELMLDQEFEVDEEEEADFWEEEEDEAMEEVNSSAYWGCRVLIDVCPRQKQFFT